MPADGLGLQTTISNSGAVAKTQARGQPAQQPTAPFSEKVDPGKDTHVERLKRGEPAERGRVEPDPEEERRRRQPREPESGAEAAGETPADAAAADRAAGEEGTDEAGEAIGRIVDCRA